MQMPNPPNDLVRFGIFQLDLKARELHKAGVKVKLQDQPFRVLALLVDRAGLVVTREELRQKVWPTDVYVGFDQGLNNAVKKVRDALGDSADSPRFIETVERQGYRFVAPIGAVPRPAAEPRFLFGLPMLWNTALIGLTAASLLAGLAYWVWHGSAMSAKPTSAQVTLAVLPFDNLRQQTRSEPNWRGAAR
jgi:DNA-binding winged helix-turn-helix (wHTH) protein